MLRMNNSRLHRITRPKVACEGCSGAPRGCESPGQSRVVDPGGYVEVARVLLEHDADTNANAQDDLQVDKNTHTHLASKGGCVETSPDASRKWHTHEIVPGIRVCTISRSIRATSTHPPAYAKCSGLRLLKYRPRRSTPSVAFGRTTVGGLRAYKSVTRVRARLRSRRRRECADAEREFHLALKQITDI
jgi:hypothetical protein